MPPHFLTPKTKSLSAPAPGARSRGPCAGPVEAPKLPGSHGPRWTAGRKKKIARQAGRIRFSQIQNLSIQNQLKQQFQPAVLYSKITPKTTTVSAVRAAGVHAPGRWKLFRRVGRIVARHFPAEQPMTFPLIYGKLHVKKHLGASTSAQLGKWTGVHWRKSQL